MSIILDQPDRPKNVPEKAQWLAGQGAGSWFFLSKPEDPKSLFFRIIRYSPSGNVECNKIFKLNDNNFNHSKEYKFTYLSHCASCTILQNNNKFTFKVHY